MILSITMVDFNAKVERRDLGISIELKDWTGNEIILCIDSSTDKLKDLGQAIMDLADFIYPYDLKQLRLLK